MLTALFAVITVVAYRSRGWTWVSIGMLFTTVVIGFGSILESLVLRIELTDDALIVSDLLGRRHYALTEIERIEEGRGVAPVLLLKSGKWVKLPSAGASIGNSVRAWLRQGG